LTTGDLLERLHGEGIELSLSSREGYVIATPEWVLTEEIESAIIDHKPEIIDILKENATFRVTGSVRSVALASKYFAD
jgi:hypothetical protein